MRTPSLPNRNRTRRPRVFVGKQPEPAEKPKAEYPPDHEPGMRVPKGGSCCANCKFLGDDKASCTNEYFIKWNGSEKLPAAADEYCSDWYEPGEAQSQ